MPGRAKAKWLMAFAAGMIPGGLHGCATPQPYIPPDYLAAVLTVNTANYSGGLTRADRAIADRIHTALLSRYYASCDDASPFAGELISSGDDGKKPLPSLDRVDPDLAFLIRALDNPNQEVRDIAAYTIGLLGPSANAAKPFLIRKFDTRAAKGGWYGVGLEGVACQPVGSMSVRDAIPDSVRISGPLATKSDAYIIATLYLDPDVEYPRGILNGAFHDLDRERNSGGPLLVKILESDAVGTSKQAEAAEALSQLPASYSQDALPALLHLAASDNRELRYQVTNALVRIHNERAIPLLIEQIEDESWTADWQRYLCEYGARAIAAENKLMEVSIRASAWPSVAHKTVETLGCIRSTKAIPMLIGLLDAPDWALNIAAAKALGKIGQPTSEVLTALKQLSQNHWSARVKMAAFNALQQLGANPAPVLNISDHVKDDDDPEVLGLPYPFDHGLPWCDDKARYSIDGEKWFTVKWISSTLERVPLGFRPKTDLLIQKIGTQTFLRVRDGWLFGSDGFEGEGVLAHVSNSGVVTEMEAGTGAPFGHASIVRIVRVKDRFFALGSELLKVGHAGVLFELSKSAEGKWTSTRRAILPGPPGVYAIAPTGDLLVSDGPNDYAVIEDQIVPLKCEKTLPGSYFSRH